MASEHHDSPSADEPHGATAAGGPDAETRPQVHERWWWTGTFRAVLGAVVVGYQWPVVSTGDANVLNWVMVAAGAAVVVWGLSLVWRAYQDQRTTGAGG